MAATMTDTDPAAFTVTNPRDGLWVVSGAEGKWLVRDLRGVYSCTCGEKGGWCEHMEAASDTWTNDVDQPTTDRIPLPSDPMFRGTDLHLPPLPDWVSAIRPHQWHAVQQVLEAFERGAKVVWLDAPTGSGKTLIGELVRRMLDVPALYVCSGKTLQDQFVADFEYACVLKGRANYPTLNGPADITAADCTKGPGGDGCGWCDEPGACPYQVAKAKALVGDLAVVNTAYLMAEANGPGRFSGRDLGILDECDVLEQELMGFVEFRLTDRVAKELKVTVPAKGSHMTTIVKWVGDVLKPAVAEGLRRAKGQGVLAGMDGVGADVKRARKVKQLGRLLADCTRIADVDVESGGGWVRDNDAGALVLKPVRVDGYGQKVLWRHAARWLCMSATIVSAEQMAESMGLGSGEWAVVRVPMTFPVENRPVYQCPVVGMTAKDKDTAWPEMVKAVQKVIGMDKYRGERVLVHAVSYALADAIVKGLRGCGREVVTYRNAGDREKAIARYRSVPGAVMVASSLDRGVDLKGDDCRCVIVAKVPFPYLGDPQVSKRMHAAGGDEWYRVQTVRTVVQMTGRGVRSADDWADTWVLDAQFGTNLWKRSKRLFPEWFREAVEFVPRREVMER